MTSSPQPKQESNLVVGDRCLIKWGVKLVLLK